MSAACDHRRIQRTLFRMQADPGFARAVLAGDATALASTGLTDADASLLREASLAGVTADPGEKRRTQLLGNLTSEFQLTLAAAARARKTGFLPAFLASAEFHTALAEGGRLPLAFAAYARRASAGDHVLAAIVRLETALVELRRGTPLATKGPPPPRRDEVGLAERARLLPVPAGTLDEAARLRAFVDAGASEDDAAPAAGALGPGEELLALVAALRTSAQRLSEVRVEALAPPADALAQRLANRPMSADERAAFAREHGAEPADLEAFLDGLVADGFVVRGR